MLPSSPAQGDAAGETSCGRVKTARRSRRVKDDQRNARSERRTEDMAQKDGQNRPQHDGHDAPEAQLLPTVVHDQHSVIVVW